MPEEGGSDSDVSTPQPLLAAATVAREGEMTVYYRGPYAHITTDFLEVWTPEYRRYRIDELAGVQVVPGAPGRRSPGPLLPAVTVLVAIALPIAHAPVGLLAAVMVLAVASTVAAACLRQAGQPYELCATHRGRRVTLFRCADARTFGQVRRALARAIEQHADW